MAQLIENWARYNIVNEADLEQAARSLTAYFEREKAKMVTFAVTLTETQEPDSDNKDSELIGISAGAMEPASGIEPPTCGLRNRCSTN